MEEEKPTFKVTDRRLFNADGSPRDIEREEVTPAPVEPAAIPTTGTAAREAGASADNVASFEAGKARADESRANAERADAERATAAPPTEPAQAEEEFYDAAGDPTGFINLVMFIVQPAAAALGLTEHPATGAPEIDLPLAKHCIDLLGTLQEKTRGRLSLQEQQTLDGLLSELRMQYVSMTSRVRPAPRGFSGSDITGGR